MKVAVIIKYEVAFSMAIENLKLLQQLFLTSAWRSSKANRVNMTWPDGRNSKANRVNMTWPDGRNSKANRVNMTWPERRPNGHFFKKLAIELTIV